MMMPGQLFLPVPTPDTRLRNALLVAIVMSAAFAYGQLMALAAPALRSPIVGITAMVLPTPVSFQITRIGLFVARRVAAVAGIAVARRSALLDPFTRRRVVRTGQLIALTALETRRQGRDYGHLAGQ